MINVKLSRERLINGRVHAPGDVVVLPEDFARAVVRQGDGRPVESGVRTADADQPPAVRKAVRKKGGGS